MTSLTQLRTESKTALAQLMADSFHGEVDLSERWIEDSGLGNWRVIEDGQNHLVGALLLIEMAQWFGGKPVPMTGLAGVAVAPEGRGRKTGQTLIQEAVAEMRGKGVGLSALYGSTSSFYRRCGYERAGSRFLAEINLKELSLRGGPLEVRPLDCQSAELAEALQRNFVRGQACLDRGPYLWNRVRSPRGKTTQGYGFFRGEELEGYAYLYKDCSAPSECTLEVTDLVLTTAESVSTFLGFLSGHRAMIGKARWPSPANSAVLMRLLEPWQYQVHLHEHWMLRIVDLRTALLERGYAPGLDVELSMLVTDPWFSENSGRWILKVCAGQATLEKGGSGDLDLDICALAALYSGFMSAQELMLSGKLSGLPETLILANAVFGGEVPQLLDFF